MSEGKLFVKGKVIEIVRKPLPPEPTMHPLLRAAIAEARRLNVLKEASKKIKEFMKEEAKEQGLPPHAKPYKEELSAPSARGAMVQVLDQGRDDWLLIDDAFSLASKGMIGREQPRVLQGRTIHIFTVTIGKLNREEWYLYSTLVDRARRAHLR